MKKLNQIITNNGYKQYVSIISDRLEALREAGYKTYIICTLKRTQDCMLRHT